jgi:hypothetical protein
MENQAVPTSHNTQQQETETINTIYNHAAHLLIEQKMTHEEAKGELIRMGVDADGAIAVVESISEQIQKARNEKANKDMLYGALWCIGGTVLTVANIGFIFWGAIIFGGIQFFTGVANYNKD